MDDQDEKVPTSEILLYQTEGGRTKIEVRLQDGTVWLTQKLIAELFQKDVRTINEHIKNIYDEGEAEAEATIRKFRIVQQEGARDVARTVDFYNLDHAEDQARRRKPIHMADWRDKLDAFLKFNEREILDDPGKVSMEVARELAVGEYEKFAERRLRGEVDSEEDEFDEISRKYLPPENKEE